jgi:hypothetical protein
MSKEDLLEPHQGSLGLNSQQLVIPELELIAEGLCELEL